MVLIVVFWHKIRVVGDIGDAEKGCLKRVQAITHCQSNVREAHLHRSLVDTRWLYWVWTQTEQGTEWGVNYLLYSIKSSVIPLLHQYRCQQATYRLGDWTLTYGRLYWYDAKSILFNLASLESHTFHSDIWSSGKDYLHSEKKSL